MPLPNQILTWLLLFAEAFLFVSLLGRLPAFNVYLLLPISYSAASLLGWPGAATHWRAAVFAAAELTITVEAVLLTTRHLKRPERVQARAMAALAAVGFSGFALLGLEAYPDFDATTYALRIGLHIFCFGMLAMSGLYVGLNGQDAPLFPLRHCALMLVYFGSMIAAASVRDRQSYWLADGINVGVHLGCVAGWIWLIESEKPTAQSSL